MRAACDGPGDDAIALIEVDGELPDAVLEQARAIDGVFQAAALHL